MALDYLENMHPAILLNQILAVNLANAYFILVASAKDATKVEVVNKSLLRLRKQTEDALGVLAEEAANATCSFHHYAELEDNVSNFVSVETIAVCEGVCASLSEAEVMISLATSLLQKFPGQYVFIQTILKESNGGEINLSDLCGRACILDSIYMQQQQQHQSEPNSDENVASPRPVLREYMLRNLDDSSPCQLSVRYGDDNVACGGMPGKESAALMIALTKTQEN
jgi:Rab3 GTPase-activating protein catalytic subunit